MATRRRGLLGSLVESALGRPMTAIEHTALDQALRQVVARPGTPTLPMVVDALFNPTLPADGATIPQLVVDGREVGHALRRLVSGDLAGLFDGESTVTFDPSLPMVSLDLSGICGSDQLIAMVMACASAWMEAALSDPDGGPRWVIYDEAWRLLRQPAPLARMQSQWKLSRGLGIANLMIIHRLSDLEARRGRRLRSQSPRPGPAGRLFDQDHLPARVIRGPTHRPSPRPVGGRTGRAARTGPRRRALASRPTRVRRAPPGHRRRAAALRHKLPNVRTHRLPRQDMTASPARPSALNSTDTLLLTAVFAGAASSVVLWAGAAITAVLSGRPVPRVDLAAGVRALSRDRGNPSAAWDNP